MNAMSIAPFLRHACDIYRVKNESAGGSDAEYELPERGVPCLFQEFMSTWIAQDGNTKQLNAVFFFAGDMQAIPIRSKIIFRDQIFFVERCAAMYEPHRLTPHHYEVMCV